MKIHSNEGGNFNPKLDGVILVSASNINFTCELSSLCIEYMLKYGNVYNYGFVNITITSPGVHRYL